MILLPAATGFGLPEFVALRSANVPEVIPMVEVAELLARFESRVAVPTVAVSVMEPVAPAFTLYTTVNVPEYPAGTVASVHCGGKVPVQLHPVAPVIDWNVVFVGVVSLNVAVLQLLGPVFVTVWV